MHFLKPITLFVAALLISSPMAFAQFDPSDEMGEGFDKQSPEEIAKARKEIQSLFGTGIQKKLSPTEEKAILDKYQHLDPKKLVPTDLLETAVIYFDQNKSKFPNQAYIVVINFKPRSDKYRFFVINMATGDVERFHVAHGTGSDKNKDGIAEVFKNVVNSGASSLGFIRTAEVYSGKFKRSVRLDGLSSTNSKVRERAIVLHGWDNAHEANVIQGWSWGCPALDWSVKDGVIDKVKEGALMYMGQSTR